MSSSGVTSATSVQGVSRFGFGPVPAGGQWVKLVVPAWLFNLNGKTITGFALDSVGGRLWVDRVGHESCSTPVASTPAAIAAETIWFDDAPPTGAALHGAWTWDPSQKASGTQSNTTPNNSEWNWHWFENATQALTTQSGDNLFVYALVDPCDPPREIMVGWHDGTWEHRAYWGEDIMNVGTPPNGRFRLGDVPPAGQWVRLEIPTGVTGLAGRTITGIAFDVFGGQVWFDRVGKYSCSTPAAEPPATESEERIWFDDLVPGGARTFGTWQWDTTQKASGTQSHTMPATLGFVDQLFDSASETLTAGADDELFSYVMIDPCDPPTRIMLAWNDGTWDHRAIWGDPLTLPYGMVVRIGDIPSVRGQWIKLAAPVDTQNLAGVPINGMYFGVWGGKAWFDRAGVQPRPQAQLSHFPPPMLSSAFDRAQVTNVPSPRRYSFYTPELNLLAETTLTTSDTPPVAYEYIWFNGQPVAQIETATNTVHHYFNDHLGTPILTTDTTGTVDWRVERESYGRIVSVRTGATRHQPLAFPGQEEDETERSYNIFRWYRDGWGRYTQADPIGLRGGDLNIFRYALSRPTGVVDPLGLDIRVCCRPFDFPGLSRIVDHCYIESNLDRERHTWGLHGTPARASLIFGRTVIGSIPVDRLGIPRPDDGADRANRGEHCGPWMRDCSGCLNRELNRYPREDYSEVSAPLEIGSGRNSNTFVRCMLRKCGIDLPQQPTRGAVGWDQTCPPGY